MALGRNLGRFAAACALLALGVGVGFLVATRWHPTEPPASGHSVAVLVPNANVLVEVRDLARLQSASFHMERVIDLTEKQSKLFGLIQTEDAILLVAAADVQAGVDLGKLGPQDIEADPATGRARVELPPAEVFGSALDETRTYVHTRHTGVLAQRRENLETRARQAAERTLLQAALDAGILARAEHNAIRTVRDLVRGLGYRTVDVHVRGE